MRSIRTSRTVEVPLNLAPISAQQRMPPIPAKTTLQPDSSEIESKSKPNIVALADMPISKDGKASLQKKKRRMQQGTAPSSAKAAYRLLMRTVQTTFNRDQRAIQCWSFYWGTMCIEITNIHFVVARQKARAEFQKNAHLTDENAIHDVRSSLKNSIFISTFLGRR